MAVWEQDAFLVFYVCSTQLRAYQTVNKYLLNLTSINPNPERARPNKGLRRSHSLKNKHSIEIMQHALSSPHTPEKKKKVDQIEQSKWLFPV